MTQPKYLLATHGGHEWIIRTRHPPIMALVVNHAGGVITFDLFPLPIIRQLGEAKVEKLTDSLYRWYQHAKGTPYSYVASRS